MTPHADTARSAAIRAVQATVADHCAAQQAAGRPPLTWEIAARAVEAATPHLCPATPPPPPEPPPVRPSLRRAATHIGAGLLLGGALVAVGAHYLAQLTWLDVAAVSAPFGAAVLVMTIINRLSVANAYATGYLDADAKTTSAYAAGEAQAVGMMPPAATPPPLSPWTTPFPRSRPFSYPPQGPDDGGGATIVFGDEGNSGPGRGSL